MDSLDNYIQQIADYVKENLTKGYTVDALKFSLINQGYSKISIERAIDLANKQLAEKAPIMKEKPQITFKVINEENTPIEVFEKKSKKFSLKKIFGFFE